MGIILADQVTLFKHNGVLYNDQCMFCMHGNKETNIHAIAREVLL